MEWERRGEVEILFTTKTPDKLKILCERHHKASGNPVIGVTTGAFILNSKVINSGTLRYPLRLNSLEILAETFSEGDFESVGRDFVKFLKELKNSGVDLSRCLLFLFSDGTNTDGETLIDVISRECPEVAVAGGMASAITPHLPTAVCYNGKLIMKGAAGIVICGRNLRIFQSFLFDWEEIGDYHLITDSEGNRVYTIDGIPATKFYGRLLGEEVEKLLPDAGINYPLVYHRNGIPIARACLKKFPDGSLNFAGHLPKGVKVKLSSGNLRGFSSSKENWENIETVARKSQMIFIFSCIARKNFLKGLAEIELIPFMNVPNVGFFTHGEFFKKPGEEGYLFNETLTVAGIATEDISRDVPSVDEKVLYPHKNSEAVRTYFPIFHFLKKIGRELDIVKNSLSRTKSCIIVLEREPGCKWFCSFISENAKDILGIDHISIKSMKVNAETVLINLVFKEDRNEFRKAIHIANSTGKAEVDFRIIVDGKIRWIRAFISTLKDGNTDIIVHTFQDVTCNKEVEFLAVYDPLTEFYNRRVLEKIFRNIKKAKRWNAALFIDIDRFKKINDLHGHETGDEVLRYVAECIRNSIRKKDIAIRYAGDEFLVLLFDIGSSKHEAIRRAESAARRILKKIKESNRFNLKISISVSIGVEVFRNAQNLDRVITSADKNMYIAKQQGGNRYVIRKDISA